MVNWLKWPKRKEEQRLEVAVAKDRPIVHFTDTALDKMLEVLESNGGPSQTSVRITAEEGPSGGVNYGMALKDSIEPEADDTVIESKGITVLVDARSLPHVNRCTVDFLNDPLRPGFKVDPPQTEFDQAVQAHAAVVASSRPQLDLSHPVIRMVQSVIDQQVNPAIASHGGRARLIDVRDDVAYVELGGGCQGCAMASVTLKQGVEQMIKQAVPQIREVIDTTDHAAGSNPYFESEKGGASPFHQSAKG
jgi:Fe/S biogenesis protein NfuA